MKDSVYSRAVLRACQLLGGPEQVAVRVGVSRLLIQAFLKGSVQPPQDVFLKLVDILMAADGYPSIDRSSLDRARSATDRG